MTIKYRLYADGSLVSEEDFEERDNSLPYYDDYFETDVPVELEDEDSIITYIETFMFAD